MKTLRKTRPRRPRDPEGTRAALLENAGLAFAALGYDGARIDEIAARAGVNKRMIYAYFGDKDALYRAVLDAHLSGLAGLARHDDPSGTPRARAEAMIRRYFAFLAEHDDFARLVSWEALSRVQRGRAILVDRVGTGLEPLHAILRAGIAAGDFRADLDPRLWAMSVNALLIGYLNHRSFLETLWHTDLGTPEARARVLDAILRLVFDGICVPGGLGAPRPAERSSSGPHPGSKFPEGSAR